MYHIKNDKRVKKSAELICTAVLELLKEKEFNNITITDIQKKSYVGRATFYRLFDGTADVLSYMCDITMDKVLKRHGELKGQSAKEITVFFINEWIKNEALLQAIFSSNHFDVLHRAFKNHADETAADFFPNLSVAPKQKDYVVYIASSAMAGGLYAWLEHGKSESAEEIYVYIKKSTEIFYNAMHN